MAVVKPLISKVQKYWGIRVLGLMKINPLKFPIWIVTIRKLAANLSTLKEIFQAIQQCLQVMELLLKQALKVYPSKAGSIILIKKVF